TGCPCSSSRRSCVFAAICLAILAFSRRPAGASLSFGGNMSMYRNRNRQEDSAMDQPSAAVIRDPVCGMLPEPGRITAEHDGRTFHFCSQSCRDRFVTDPGVWIEAKDPVCGMRVDRASARFLSKHEGKRYWFCSQRCQTSFEADPERHATGQPAPEPMPAGTRYTCPMHPEIVRDEFGDCPICGMAL